MKNQSKKYILKIAKPLESVHVDLSFSSFDLCHHDLVSAPSFLILGWNSPYWQIVQQARGVYFSTPQSRQRANRRDWRFLTLAGKRSTRQSSRVLAYDWSTGVECSRAIRDLIFEIFFSQKNLLSNLPKVSGHVLRSCSFILLRSNIDSVVILTLFCYDSNLTTLTNT